MEMSEREELAKQLSLLNSTQKSIQETSSWILLRSAFAKDIISAWEREFQKASNSPKPFKRRLVLLYLCNDIVQNSKRNKTNSFIDEFKMTYHRANTKTKDAVKRILSVWGERKIYSKSYLISTREAVGIESNNPKASKKRRRSSLPSGSTPPALKRARSIETLSSPMSQIVNTQPIVKAFQNLLEFDGIIRKVESKADLVSNAFVNSITEKIAKMEKYDTKQVDESVEVLKEYEDKLKQKAHKTRLLIGLLKSEVEQRQESLRKTQTRLLRCRNKISGLSNEASPSPVRKRGSRFDRRSMADVNQRPQHGFPPPSSKPSPNRVPVPVAQRSSLGTAGVGIGAIGMARTSPGVSGRIPGVSPGRISAPRKQVQTPPANGESSPSKRRSSIVQPPSLTQLIPLGRKKKV